MSTTLRVPVVDIQLSNIDDPIVRAAFHELLHNINDANKVLVTALNNALVDAGATSVSSLSVSGATTLTGAVTASNLAGVGTRNVVASATGVLSAT